MAGGTGNDWVDYSNAASGVVVYLTSIGGNSSAGAAAGDSYNGIENVLGSLFDDILRPLAGGRADGGAGQDIIFDSTGEEILRGGVGADLLSDVHSGEDNNKDIFVIGEGLSSDRVEGFSVGQDLLWLPNEITDHLAFNAQGVLDGNYLLSYVGGGNTATADGHAQLIYDGQAKKLWYDSDGTGAAAPTEIAYIVGGPQALFTNYFQAAPDI